MTIEDFISEHPELEKLPREKQELLYTICSGRINFSKEEINNLTAALSSNLSSKDKTKFEILKKYFSK